MSQKEFLKKYFLRFAISLSLLSLIFYTVYHVFAGSSSSLMTLPVREVTDLRLISGDAYLFREETVLTSPSKGLVNELARDAVKVGKGSVLAEVWNGYSDERLTASQLELDRVNAMIELLEDSALPANVTLSQSGLFRTEAENTYLSLQNAKEERDWTAIEALGDSLLISLNRYASITGGEATVEETLSGLRRTKGELLLGERVAQVTASQSGYFYGRGFVDGYETLFTPQALNSMTADRFFELIQAEPVAPESGVAIGKLVGDYEWSLAIPFDAEERAWFAAGGTYRFQFPENRNRELTLLCEHLIETPDGGAIVIFSSDEIPRDFNFFRSQRVQITVGSLEGYYIPTTALREQDGVTGVFIFENSTICFRRIEIVYQGDGYVIAAERGERGDDYLDQLDILITSGKNLYEGRVYK